MRDVPRRAPRPTALRARFSSARRSWPASARTASAVGRLDGDRRAARHRRSARAPRRTAAAARRPPAAGAGRRANSRNSLTTAFRCPTSRSMRATSSQPLGLAAERVAQQPRVELEPAERIAHLVRDAGQHHLHALVAGAQRGARLFQRLRRARRSRRASRSGSARPDRRARGAPPPAPGARPAARCGATARSSAPARRAARRRRRGSASGGTRPATAG